MQQGGDTNPWPPPGETDWVPPEPAVLQDLLPQFAFLELAGRGGMGAVYRARQVSLQREVAVKVLPPRAGSPERRERFHREALALGRLRHPRIVAVHDFIAGPGGLDVLVMEYLPGSDVSQRLEREGRLPPDEALRIARGALEALVCAHAAGIAHRDLKPSNLLLDADGAVKVADFGLCSPVAGAAAEFRTRTQQAFGTPDYLAPECLRPGAAPDARADLYSLGATLYHMLTGEPPRGMFKLPSLRVPGLDPRLDPILCRALEPDPADRHASAADMLAELEALGQPAPAQPRRSRAPLGLALAATAVLGVAGMWLAIRGPDSQGPSPAGSAPPAKPADPAQPAASTAANSADNLFQSHRYEWFPGEFTWEAAAKLAEQRGGALAVPSTAGENEWLLARAAPRLGPGQLAWLGGRRAGDGVWSWVTGEPFAFAAWGAQPPAGTGELRLALLRPDEAPDRLAWRAFAAGDRPRFDAGPEQGARRCAGYLVEWNSESSRPFLQDAPWQPLIPAADTPVEDGWHRLAPRGAWRSRLESRDGAIRATFRYQRDGGSLGLRYHGPEKPMQTCFISGEGGQVVFLVADTLAASRAGRRWTFDLPARLREGEAFTLEASLIGDRFAVLCNGVLVGTGETGRAEPAAGRFVVLTANQEAILTRDEAWRAF